MKLSPKLPLNLALAGAVMASAFLPFAAKAQPNVLENARRACEQTANSRGLRVLDISYPVMTGRNRAEATLTVRERGGGGWDDRRNDDWRNDDRGPWNWGRGRGREESYRCVYNNYSGQVYLERGVANNPGRPYDDSYGRPGTGAPRLLGTAQLSYRENDVEGVDVNEGCRPGISQIQLRARRGAVDLESVRVRFANGEEDRIRDIPQNLNPRESSGWIDLRGGNRCVRRITIKGDTRDFARREGVVEIWGR
jgi:hypothetical protein